MGTVVDHRSFARARSWALIVLAALAVAPLAAGAPAEPADDVSAGVKG